MTGIEQATRAEAERRWPGSARDLPLLHETFTEGASWLAEYLLSDEGVERAARAAFHERQREDIALGLLEQAWEEAGEGIRRGWLEFTRAALTAALGTNHNEQEQR